MYEPLAILISGAVIFAGLALGIYWTIAAYRVFRTVRALPTAKSGLELADKQPPKGSVCVVIPAHNEDDVIEDLVRSLAALEYREARFVLALDRCTDRTADLARAAIGDDERFEIVEIDHCPDDWAGKVHAVYSGVVRSEAAGSADYLLFSDADCTFHPRMLEATIALLEARSLDMLSLFSTLRTESLYEWVTQFPASIELARWYPLNRANAAEAEHRRPFANGQFMLFRGDTYRAIEGHEGVNVRDALLEDIAFAKKLHYNGHRPGLLLADGIVRCRMYRSWEAFRKGWKRIFTESAGRKPGRLRTMALRARITGLLPVFAATGLIVGIWLSPKADLQPLMIGTTSYGLVIWFLVQLLIHRSAHAPISSVLASPLGMWRVGGILKEAARDLEQGTPTDWGGRAYARGARSKDASPSEA